MSGNSIPERWQWATFSEVARIASNLVDPKALGGLPHIAPDNIERNTGRLLAFNTVAEDRVTSPKHAFRPGQLLYSKIRPYLNKCVRVDFDGLCSADMYPLDVFIDPRYVHRYILTRSFVSAVAEAAGSRTVLPKTNQEQLSQVPVPVAPLAEQGRIVERLDSFVSRLDDATMTLERVQRNLKRYRASVLKAAVEGRLVPTEAELARSEGRDYEPAFKLLDRILAERRQRWERSGRKGKYEEPSAVQGGTATELPEGWCWSDLGTLADVQGGITKNVKRTSALPLREVPYLRVANVQRGWLDLEEIATIPASEDEIASMRLETGDVLFNEGGDRDKLGRGWIWQGQIAECIHQNHVFRARPLLPEISSKFISWYGNTEGQLYFFSEGKQTTNLASINMTKLRGLPVMLPPAREQARIESAVDAALTEVEHAETTVVATLQRLTRLRQSILKWAFEGRLVDQDPNDEPAAVLLERIKAERAAAALAPKSRTKKLRVKVTR